MLNLFKESKQKHLETSLFYMCAKDLDDMLCSSGYIEHDRLNLVVLGHFLSFYLPKNLKNQIFENMKKIAGDIFLSCIPKITIK